MTKKRTGGGGKDEAASEMRKEERAEVAWHLAALMRDPATPAELYNLLLDWSGEREVAYLNSLRGQTAYADHLLRVLNWHASAAKHA
jgi:hypothetical protein